MKKLTKLKNFINHEIWRINPKEYSPTKSFLLRQLRILLIARKGFTEKQVQLKASALTFYSMLSVVPVVAMLFAIAKGFGFQQKLEKQLLTNFEGQQEVVEKIIEFANSMLENTKGGIIAGIGIVVLFWAVMKVLGNIEKSLNDIWQIKKSRPIVRKFSDYFSIMLIGPVFFILSSSANVFITTQISTITEGAPLLGYLGPFVQFLIKLIPYVTVWLLFTGLYIVMPNTKVKFKSAIIGGIIAGSLFTLIQFGYIHFQVSMSRYNAIYGSFAALPLFLIWLQISWLVVLFGAEISFANQNLEKYEIESESLNISNHLRKILSILTMHLIIQEFSKGDPPLTASQIAHRLHLPIRIVRDMIFDLVQCKLVTETSTTSEKEFAYQPALDINMIYMDTVIQKLDLKGADDISIGTNKQFEYIENAVKSFNELISKSPPNKLLKDI